MSDHSQEAEAMAKAAQDLAGTFSNSVAVAYALTSIAHSLIVQNELTQKALELTAKLVPDE